MPGEARLGYQPALDGLRAVAVLAVMLYHSGLLPGGWLGVDVFFALSGFLITSLLLEEHAREGRVSLARFYARRALRLLPALVGLLVVAGGAMVAWGPPEQARERLLDGAAVLLYVANWAIAHGRPLFVFGHAWSLAIEEQFYLLWPPLLAALLGRMRRRPALVAVVAVAAAAAVAWRLVAIGGGARLARVFVGLDTRADSLLVGCALGMLLTWRMVPDAVLRGPAARWTGGAAAAALGVLFLAAEFPFAFWFHQASTSAALAATLLIGSLVAGGPLARILATRPLVGVGVISYGLYLWHYPVFYAFGVLLGSSGSLAAIQPLPLAVAWAVTFAVCIASYLVLEAPALRLKSRLGHARAGAAPRAATLVPGPHPLG